jgi:predicted nuclease of restriction endonuclease-like (RecB) superfamily
MTMGKNLDKSYIEALQQAKTLILEAQQKFLMSANRQGMEMRWQLGKLIEENTVRHDWGQAVLDKLSDDLNDAFQGNKSFSTKNLRNMRQFFAEYKNCDELAEIAKTVRWGTNIVIMSKVKNIEARRFYLQMASQTQCSRDIIIAQISACAYERGHLQDKLHNFHNTLPEVVAHRAENIMQGSYLFEVAEPLGAVPKLAEKALENEMVSRIKDTIMMLGKGFAFIGNQYHLHEGGRDYYIDLLFTNRVTHSLIAVELKVGEFKAEYASKMSLYLNLLDKHVKLPEENPSIGLILCNDKNNIEVEYALRDINKPVGVAELHFAKVLPSELVGALPDAEELEATLKLQFKNDN